MKIIAAILINLLATTLAQTSTQICSSSCVSWVSACKNFNYNGCIVCDPSLYLQYPDASGCIPKPQVNIEAIDLKNPIDLSSFNTSLYSSFSCSGFEIAGKFTNGNKISKNYKISNPHHKMRVRFSVVLIGPMTAHDKILVSMDGNNFTFNYQCTSFTKYCSIHQCIRNVDFEIDHAQESLALEIVGSTAVGTEWGIKDLIVASHGCHPSCSSCYGGGYQQCLFCKDGYYLQGNVCVQNCSFFTMTSTKFCVSLCPNGFYASKTNYCQQCYKGCQYCSGPTMEQCLMKNVAGSSFYKNIGLNITIIVFCMAAIALGAYCFIRRCQRKKQIQVADNGDLSKKINDTTQNFIEDNSYNHSHEKSRDVLVVEKDEHRSRKVSMLQQIHL